MAFLITKKLPINEPFVLRITQEDSPIRNCGSFMCLWIEIVVLNFITPKLVATSLKPWLKVRYCLNSAIDVDVRSRFNITLQRWQALSPPSLLHQADWPLLTRLIHSSRIKAKQQIGELTELHLGLDRRSTPRERCQGETSSFGHLEHRNLIRSDLSVNLAQCTIQTIQV